MKTNRNLWIILDVIIAALIGILGNVVADYFQDRYSILGDLPSSLIIGSLFVLTLSISIILRIRKRTANDKAQGKLGNIDISSGDTIQQVAGGDIQQNIYALPNAIIYLLLVVAVLALTISVYSLSPGLRNPSIDFPQPSTATIQPTTRVIVITEDNGGLFGDDQDYTPPLISGPIFLVILSIASVGLAIILYYVAYRTKR